MSFDQFNPGTGVIYFCPLALDKSLVIFHLLLTMLCPLFHTCVPVCVGACGDATCDPEGADGSLDFCVRACLIARGTFCQPPGACLICSTPFAGST